MKLFVKYWPLIIGFFAIGIFLILRLVNLNIIPVFVDEAIYIRWSQIMKNEASLRFLPQSDGKPPLFMWITISFFKLSKDPLIAGRLVSVMAGAGSLLGVGVLAFLLTSSLWAGVLASLVYAITPFTVFFDRMALADGLLAMFGIWSLILGLLFVRKPRLDLAMLLGFAIGGGLLTKSPAVFFYLWQIVLAVFFFKFSRDNKLSLLKLLGGWLVALLISQLLFNILRLGPSFHLINSRNQDYVYTVQEALSHPLSPLIYNLQTTFNWLLMLLTVPLLLIIPAGFLGRNKKVLFVLILIALVPLLSQAFIAKVYTSRYILFAVLPLLVATGVSLSFLIEKTKLKFLPSLLLFVPLSLSFAYVTKPTEVKMPFDMRNGYLEEWTAGTGQKEVAAYLIGRAKAGHKLVVGTEGYFGSLPDGLQIYTTHQPGLTVIGTDYPIVKIPDSLANSSKENEIYLVVNKSRDLLGPKDLESLELISTYPKAPRNNGTREELRLYRLIK